MKKLLVLLLSLFFLSSPSVFADDISDFKIEGIGIGESLLDYMTEDEILKQIEKTKDYYLHLNEPNKYAHVFFQGKDFQTYYALTFLVKNNSSNNYVTNKNEKYMILSVRGDKKYINDFDSCIQKRDEIVEVLSLMFINADKFESFLSHPADPSGNSSADMVSFYFEEGHTANVYCDNFEESLRINNNWSEGLTVEINSEEIDSWGNDY